MNPAALLIISGLIFVYACSTSTHTHTHIYIYIYIYMLSNMQYTLMHRKYNIKANFATNTQPFNVVMHTQPTKRSASYLIKLFSKTL